MKLYDCQIAPNPRRARIFMHEKGIDIPRVEIDVLAAENLKPEFLAISPRGLVPALELDDGTCIDEVMAICRYLEEIHPEPYLLGADPVARALVTSRQRQMEFDGMIAGSEVFRNQNENFAARSLPGATAAPLPAIPELVTRGSAILQRFFAALEKYLSETEFVAGADFSMADITAMCAVDFVGWVDMKIPASCPLTQAWYDKVAARPSAKA